MIQVPLCKTRFQPLRAFGIQPIKANVDDVMCNLKIMAPKCTDNFQDKKMHVLPIKEEKPHFLALHEMSEEFCIE